MQCAASIPRCKPSLTGGRRQTAEMLPVGKAAMLRRVVGHHGAGVPPVGGARMASIRAGVCLDRIELNLRQSSDAGGQLVARRCGIAAADCRSHDDSCK